MSLASTAKDVTVNLTAQTLTITWADDISSVFPLDGLRRACPCVECKGGHGNMGTPLAEGHFQARPQQQWKITQLEPVGRYALKIYWDDGHSLGNYSWQQLRAWHALL